MEGKGIVVDSGDSARLASLDVVILLIQPIVKGNCFRVTELFKGTNKRNNTMLKSWGGWT